MEETVGAVVLGLMIALLAGLVLYGGGTALITDSIPKCTRDVITHELSCPEIP